MSTSIDNVTSSTTERFTGRVKWFNNKAGYGFVTITDGSSAGTDIFVHHSAIGVANQQFRYLVQGEYVDFNLVPTTQNSTHKIQASNMCGIKGGKLMCETRHEYKVSRNNYNNNDVNYDPIKMPKQRDIVKNVNDDNTFNNKQRNNSLNEWTTVSKKQPNTFTNKYSKK